MDTQELHRGRLIDHLQLVVRDLAASQVFYTAVFKALEVPIGGSGEGYFWADELFVSSADSPAAQGQLTGRHHLAFQAKDRAMVDAFHEAAGKVAADRGFKTIREKILQSRKLNADYRAQVRGRRAVLVATLEERKVSPRRQADYLARFDAEVAKTGPEVELLWDLEDSFLIETEHLVDLLDRAKPEWDVSREAVFFRKEADWRTFQTHTKRLEILSEEVRKVRAQALRVSLQPAAPPAGRG